MENISLLDIRTFVDGLKQFEEKWTMFEVKDKPAAPAGNAQANMALKKGGKGIKDLPPLDKKEIEKLKKEANSTRFTTASFKAHQEKCNAESWNRRSRRLCYWCIEAPCVEGKKALAGAG